MVPAKWFVISENSKQVSSSDVTMETNSAPDEDLELDIQAGIVRSGRETVVAPPAMEPLIQCGENETLPGYLELYLKQFWNEFKKKLNK